MSGWIRLHRGWRECEVFAGEPASDREAWMHLIEIAAWKPMVRRAGKGDIIEVGRGQLHTAERTLADMWSWDRKRVKRFLNRLEKYGMISQEAGPSGNLVTICNYGRYQDDGTNEGTDNGTIRGPFEDHSRTTQEEGIRKEKKEKNVDKARGSRLTPDWVLPVEWREFAKSEKGWSDSDVSAEANTFRDHWVAQSGSKAVKADWQATWRNWVRRSYRKPSSGSAQSSDLLSGLTFSAAKEKLIELENAAEVMSTILTGEQDATWERYMAKRVAARQFRAAFEAKWPPRKDGVN
jgi:hypothetical protein